ncbi:MAG: hypothetical protein Q9171_001918 [Xanthocarpia ochracea]
MLDIDGFRMIKGLQITADAEGEWSYYIRQCAAAVGKRNFFIPGEVVGGNPLIAVYIVSCFGSTVHTPYLIVSKGQGNEPSMAESDTAIAVMTTEKSSDPSKYIREKSKIGFGSVALHYSIYRSLKRFLGSVLILSSRDSAYTGDRLDGSIEARPDAPLDIVEAYNTFTLTNDLSNTDSGLFDPRHIYGTENQDVFWWPSIMNGTLKGNLGAFIITVKNKLSTSSTTLHQTMCLVDNYGFQHKLQDFTGQGQGNKTVWLVYHNKAINKTYNFNCSDNATALIAPFATGTRVKNLLFPFEEYTLRTSNQQLSNVTAKEGRTFTNMEICTSTKKPRELTSSGTLSTGSRAGVSGFLTLVAYMHWRRNPGPALKHRAGQETMSWFRYWSRILGGSGYIQQGDLAPKAMLRRYSHFFVHGPYNNFGYDQGLRQAMSQDREGIWTFDSMTEWPWTFQLNTWGINPDGTPDKTRVFGDPDGDGVLCYRHVFCAVKLNEIRKPEHLSIRPIRASAQLRRYLFEASVRTLPKAGSSRPLSTETADCDSVDFSEAASHSPRRTVLLATMEYDIEGWGIKVNGGLGVMAQLMGKHLGHQDLIWVGRIEYDIDHGAEPMRITIRGEERIVQVQYHKLRNITYVYLDSPIFRSQSQSEPCPARMDDIDGAASVSAKYDERSFARYPVFWGLPKIENLPNPYPTDTAEWNNELPKIEDTKIDLQVEDGQAEFKRQAQEWAKLEANPDAELLVFVVRWSMQKGIDLIAGVFPTVLEEHHATQLICVGPVIDLYGRFAALKLNRLIVLYPGRVFSKPGFTAIPPFVFTGTDFALIPSRDEPSGLIAVEFARKGALGLSARVGDLGNMPGWWFTVASTTTKHLLRQFKAAIQAAIQAALASPASSRAQMRARLALQRFPVAHWKELVATMHETANKVSQKAAIESGLELRSDYNTSLASSTLHPSYGSTVLSLPQSCSAREPIAEDPIAEEAEEPGQLPSSHFDFDGDFSPETESSRKLSLGVRTGPGCESSWQASPRGSNGERIGRHTLAGKDLHQTRTSIDMTSKESGQKRETLVRMSIAKAFTHLRFGEPEIQLPDDPRLAGDAGLDDDIVDMARISQHSPDEVLITPEQAIANEHKITPGFPISSAARDFAATAPAAPSAQARSVTTSDTRRASVRFSSPSGTTSVAHPAVDNHRFVYGNVLQGKGDSTLQKLEPSFTDPTGLYYKAFDSELKDLTSKNSEDALSIESFLTLSEKDWHSRLHKAKLGRRASRARQGSIFDAPFRRKASIKSVFDENVESAATPDNSAEQFLLKERYKLPGGLRKLLLGRARQWLLYSFLLAFYNHRPCPLHSTTGQIIAATSYQIVLISGEIGQSTGKLYVIVAIYLATSIILWTLFRTLKSIYVLSMPFGFYGLAFLLIGIAPYVTGASRRWVQNAATGLYLTASSSGALYFSLNFGSNGKLNSLSL